MTFDPRELSTLARLWSRNSENVRGVKLSAEQVDMLNAIGVGEILASRAAAALREQSEKRLAEQAEQEPYPSPQAAGEAALARVRMMLQPARPRPPKNSRGSPP